MSSFPSWSPARENTRQCMPSGFTSDTSFPSMSVLLLVHCAIQPALQSFQGSQGRAYLFNSVVNVGCGPAEERVLLTGLHAVADIYCENCKTTLGWKYEHAFESSQKYKEGKYIIELAHMIKDNGWD
ncbi:protein yippee-like 2 isoform X1 [Tyto alba]|uniref:protein yippee-like 2 isoform X1 n=1 Tax=Tyto alba TaxID=56313 RepID=UPI001C66D3BD|nr:protein yippee-like 2 isoform X1 [Tyto alba]